MAHKRMIAWLVTVEWVAPRTKYGKIPKHRREVDVNALTAVSARKKVMAEYKTRYMVEMLGKPHVISIRKTPYYGETYLFRKGL